MLAPMDFQERIVVDDRMVEQYERDLRRRTFTAAHYPGQSVTILGLERKGVVSLVRFAEGGVVDYYVSWWDEGKRMSEWLPGSEIAP